MPEIEIHYIERTVHGNGIAVKAWGEIKAASSERVNAWELGLKSLEVLVLTPLTGNSNVPWPSKYVGNKGRPDNYATIYLWDSYNSEHTGSVWLDFHALGDG